jgi:spore germination protein KC
MKKGKRSVVYYLCILLFLLIAFFSNDFNLVNIQKTAIVTAMAIDKEEDRFLLTALIASPTSQGSDSGKSEQTADGYAAVQGQGKTVAEAIEAVNAKTGWYPKLVFCRVLLLGESLCNSNVFDALDYFLRSDYVADDPLLAATDGKASELLQAKPPLKAAVSEAIEKVLSDQPKRVGAVLTASLRPFAISYFSAGSSGYMPLLSIEKEEGGDIFNASKTALFRDGKRIGALDEKGTFALSCIKNPLRLAAYTVQSQGEENTLLIKQNQRKLRFLFVGDEPIMRIHLTLYAEWTDAANSQHLGALSGREKQSALYTVAGEVLSQQIQSTFAYCKGVGFDAFDAIGKLQKYENNHFAHLKDSLVERLQLQIAVRFAPIR